MIVVWAFISFLLLGISATPTKRTYATHNYYVLRHNPSLTSRASLDDVIRALNVELVEQAGELQDHWIVKQLKDAHITARDASDPVLSTFEAFKRQAHSSLSTRSKETHLARQIVSSVDYLSLQTLRQRTKRAPPPIFPSSATSSKAVAARFGIEDPMFDKQWHLVNEEYPEHTMNVTGVWDMGLTGKGVISSLVDDGLDYESEDLSSNFVRSL